MLSNGGHLGTWAKHAALRKVHEQGRRRLLDLAPQVMQTSQFWPHEYRSDGYSRPSNGTRDAAVSDLPVPPPEFWAHYCTSPETYLNSGQDDVQTMSRLLAEHGASVENAGRILELGCAGGRMLRWLAHLAPETQLWGTDIWSSAVLWCQDNLSPPMFFATNTVVPHLPFEDRSFGLVFCGSVFTHLDDLAETWFLELHRVLRPGGHLYFSINDQHTIRVFEGEADPGNYPRYYERTRGQRNWDGFVAQLHGRRDYERFRRGEAYMFTMGRSIDANVMWNSDVLCQRLEYGYRKLAITPETYGHQTSVLLERL